MSLFFFLFLPPQRRRKEQEGSVKTSRVCRRQPTISLTNRTSRLGSYHVTAESTKGTFYLFGYLRGLRRGVKVDSRPRRLAIRFFQRSPPNGVTRARLRSMAATSASVCGLFTSFLTNAMSARFHDNALGGVSHLLAVGCPPAAAGHHLPRREHAHTVDRPEGRCHVALENLEALGRFLTSLGL